MAYVETLIEPIVSDSSQRLSLLINSCSGLAYEAISSLVQRKDSKKAYEQAKTILRDISGSKFQITRSVVEECTSGPPIKANDTAGLRRLAVSLTKAEITLEENGAGEELVSTEKLV